MVGFFIFPICAALDAQPDRCYSKSMICGPVTQWLECRSYKAKVIGSNPIGSTILSSSSDGSSA